MKQRLLVFLALMLSLVLTFTLVSCGDESGKGNGQNGEEQDGEPKYVSVTKEEWIKAFTFNGVNSFTFTFAETFFETDENRTVTDTYTGTYKYNNGIFYEVAVESDPKTETTYEVLDKELNLLDFDANTEVYDRLKNFFEDDEYYGYESFTYDESTGKYAYFLAENNREYSIDFYFGQNKYVSKIIINEKHPYENATAEYSFTDYNSTEAITMPNSLLNETQDAFIQFLSTSPILNTHMSEYGKIDIDNIYEELEAIISSLSINSVTRLCLKEKNTYTSRSISFIGTTITIGQQEFIISRGSFYVTDRACSFSFIADGKEFEFFFGEEF